MKLFKAEYIFPFYFWSFSFLRILYKFINSTLLLSVVTAFCLLATIVYYNKKLINKNTVFISLIAIGFFFDVNLRNTSEISQRYFFEFIYNGFVAFIIFSQIKDYRLLLKNFSILAIITFIFLGFDGINNYPLFGDYMTFGFNLVLPTAFSVTYLIKYSKNKLYKSLLLLLFLWVFYNLFLYSNRSVLLSYLIFVILLNKEYLKKYLFFLIPVCLIILNPDILIEGINLIQGAFKTIGVETYSLRKYEILLNSQNVNDDFFSGRFNIWNDAFHLIYENIFIGGGIGSFEEVHKIYSHNFLLDLLLFHGFLIGILILYITLKSMKNLYHLDYILFLFVVILIFPKLFLSSYYTKEMFFWCLLTFFYVKKNPKIRFT
ncbi:O-antigen ligase family protein [Empedobacter brevis]